MRRDHEEANGGSRQRPRLRFCVDSPLGCTSSTRLHRHPTGGQCSHASGGSRVRGSCTYARHRWSSDPRGACTLSKPRLANGDLVCPRPLDRRQATGSRTSRTTLPARLNAAARLVNASQSTLSRPLGSVTVHAPLDCAGFLARVQCRYPQGMERHARASNRAVTCASAAFPIGPNSKSDRHAPLWAKERTEQSLTCSAVPTLPLMQAQNGTEREPILQGA